MTSNNNKTSKYTISTNSTLLQEQTEEECSPYFVNIASLPRNQIHSLRQIGLLPPDDQPEEKNDDEIECIIDSDNTQENKSSEIEICPKEEQEEISELYDILLLRTKHINYCIKGLTKQLHSNFTSLDASHSWMIYWLLHSLDILNGIPQEKESLMNIVNTIDTYWNDTTGGFSGGYNQLSHCAPTYAAILSLTIIATNEYQEDVGYYTIQLLKNKYRVKLKEWFSTLYDDSSGGYRMQHDGEVDVRAYYCIVSVSSLLNILQEEYTTNISYVVSCQTYEGGFGGEPFNEAHGGYTYCALATLAILDLLNKIDIKKCKGWIARRQMDYEGGFSGRANKLVDGCYSFWQGASMAILDLYAKEQSSSSTLSSSPTITKINESSTTEGMIQFHQALLQKYILLCAQNMMDGGLRDKPSKGTDFYHTCYNLSGYSIAQLCDDDTVVVYGHSNNVVRSTHPLYNIVSDRVHKIMDSFYNLEE